MKAARGTSKIAFISYRRADTDAVAGRIKDRLARDLPDWEVFMDVESIGAGANYRHAIDETLARSAVFVVLIGARWTGEDSARLRDPQDLVRYEIKSALARDMRIIPVLVNDARMPDARDLPEDLAPLLDRNAVELRHSRFDDDFANVVKAIAGDVRVARKPRRIGRRVASAAVGAFAGVAAAIAGLVVHYQVTGASASERIGENGATLLIPVCAVVGAAILLWRASREG
jgi:hypothetical protein